MLKKFIVNSLLIIGVLLVISPFIKDQIVVQVTNRHMAAIIPDEFEQNLNAEVEFDFAVVQPIEVVDVLATWNTNLPIIGEIIIPTVDIHLPIINGVSNASLSVGAATMKPNQVMGEGNYSLASHRMNNPNLLFTPLERVNLNDHVYLKDAHHRYTYKITEIIIIEPERVDVIEDVEGEQLLTLITCTADGTQRLKVRGELIEISSVKDSE